MLLNEFLADVQQGIIPNKFSSIPQYGKSWITFHEGRSICTRLGMWAIVDKTWTASLAKWIGERKVLEVMGGVGWLAKALSEHGIDIVCTDNNEWVNGPHKTAKFVFNVEQMDAKEAIKKHSDADILLVSWPPYDGNEVTEILKAWGNKRPVIYIGELDGGCNAPEEFFDIFEYEFMDIRLPNWNGIHDLILTGYLNEGKER